jgi:hypothetical protein
VEPPGAPQAAPRGSAELELATAWTARLDLASVDLVYVKQEPVELESMSLRPRGLALFRKPAAWRRVPLESESRAASRAGEPLRLKSTRALAVAVQ